MAERFGLRLRFALFFAALALGGSIAICGGLWLGYTRMGGPVEGYVTAGIVAGFGLLGLAAWVGLLFDENVAKPILALASELNTRARAGVDADIDEKQARYLGALAPAVSTIHDALSEARAAQEHAVALETARINREKALFETLLHDLAEGAVVLTPDNRVMLYNRVAQQLLGALGLDRRIQAFLRPEPLEHALKRMESKYARGQIEAESFLAASADGSRFFLARISPVISDEERLGHVLIFHDATEDLQVHAERDHLFNTMLEQVRRPAAALSAVLDVLQEDGEMPAKTRATFNAAMREEVDRLFTCLSDTGPRYGSAASRHWPMTEVAAEDIFDALRAREITKLDSVGGSQFMRCDGFAIVGLLALVLNGLAESETRHDITLKAEPHDHEVWLTIIWNGEETPDGLIDAWVQQPISGGYGQYTGRDVLDGHQTEIWSELQADGHRIVLPLVAAGEPVLSASEARPEFYDFNLPAVALDDDMADRPLSELSFVVFDTETTGLSPSNGDEIVQIAGVRIVNGRLLRGEVFETLVNPGRPIPAATTAVHHITDDMVLDAPGISEAGKRFHDFCQDSVLVAHNAPFDLAFLRLKEEQIGRKFSQPVLCTVLLSAALFEHTGSHTLDALAGRFGVSIAPELRHTALGDAVATAEVFQQMLKVMQGEGIGTLRQAIAAERRMTQIRKAQNY